MLHRSKRISGFYTHDTTEEALLDFNVEVFTGAMQTFAKVLLCETPAAVPALTHQLIESYPDEANLTRPSWNCLSWYLTSTDVDANILRNVLRADPELGRETDKFCRPPLAYAAALDVIEPFQVRHSCVCHSY
jgi:hypothetical protein